MQKILGIFGILSLVFLFGCTMKVEDQKNETINNDTGIIIDYSGDLIVEGIGPDVSFEPTVASDILVLKKNFEDHSDHLFFSRMFRDNYLDIFDDCIPGNIVKFEGKIKILDIKQGHHYYEVVETNTLEKVGIPNENEVLTILNRYNYCEEDKDCAAVYGKCPLPCHIGVNSKFTGTVETIVNNFWEHQESQCIYRCMEIQNVKCENYKCIVE